MATPQKSVTDTEPVVAYQAAATLVALAAGAFGIVVDPSTLVDFVLAAVAFVAYVVAAVKARSKVTPVA